MIAVKTPKFPLGQIVATPAAIEAMNESGQTADFFLDQHRAGNWGIVDAKVGCKRMPPDRRHWVVWLT